jgi:hypothetical protein
VAITELFVSTGLSISTVEVSLPNATTALASITTDGVIQIFLDASAMTVNDEYRLQVKEKVSGAGDTQRIVFEATLIGPQGAPVWVSPALVVMHGWDATLIRVGGADRSFKWSIRSVA